MIFIDESQRDLLRIVWKENIDGSIKTYKRNRVMYGTACSPYLPQRVLKQLVSDDGQHHPLAASAVTRDMYMDDIFSGATDVSSAKQLTALFGGAGMQLHKWSSNSIELLADSEDAYADVSHLHFPKKPKL